MRLLSVRDLRLPLGSPHGSLEVGVVGPYFVHLRPLGSTIKRLLWGQSSMGQTIGAVDCNSEFVSENEQLRRKIPLCQEFEKLASATAIYMWLDLAILARSDSNWIVTPLNWHSHLRMLISRFGPVTVGRPIMNNASMTRLEK